MRTSYGDSPVSFREESCSNSCDASNGTKRNVFNKDIDAKVDFVQKTCILARHVAVVVGIKGILAVFRSGQDQKDGWSITSSKINPAVCQKLGDKSNVVDVKGAVGICVANFLITILASRSLRQRGHTSSSSIPLKWLSLLASVWLREVLVQLCTSRCCRERRR